MFRCCRPPWADDDSDGAELLTAPSMMPLASAFANEGSVAAGDQLTADLISSIATGRLNVAPSGPIPSLTATSTGSSVGSASALGALSAVSEFFAGLVSTPAPTVAIPSSPDAGINAENPTATPETSLSRASAALAADGAPAAPHVEYKRYALKGYVDLPAVLQPFLKLPVLDHMLIIGLPTAAPSVGLAGYRARVPRQARKDAPFLVVIDEPGKLSSGGFTDDRYIWVEFALGDVFRLDVGEMSKMEDYLSKLSKKARWNFKDRQKKFNNAKSIAWEMVTVPAGAAGRAFLQDRLWPLYKQTGEKNGFTVLTEEEFYSFHEGVEGIQVMVVYDVRGEAKAGGKKDAGKKAQVENGGANGADDPTKGRRIVSFCTGVRWRDVLMPMWCGTDYDNDLARTASTYFNMLYEYVRMGIADPKVKWVDLGASRRAAKTAIGFSPYPSSGYFRCKNAVMQALVEEMMARYYKPERLINDP